MNMGSSFRNVCINKSLTKLEIREPRPISDIIKHCCLHSNDWETHRADAVLQTHFISCVLVLL